MIKDIGLFSRRKALTAPKGSSGLVSGISHRKRPGVRLEKGISNRIFGLHAHATLFNGDV